MHYKMIDQTREFSFNGITHLLHRIVATCDFRNIKKNTIGGWIEIEDNLSQLGDCWVGYEAVVFDNARIEDNAQILDHAIVCGNAFIFDNAKILDHAIVCGDTHIFDCAKVTDNAMVSGDVKLSDNVFILKDAEISGTIALSNDIVISTNGQVSAPNHILHIGPIGSRDGYTTFYKGREDIIMVQCGCFNGTIDEFLNAVNEKHKDSEHAVIYKAVAELAKLRIKA